MRKKTKAITERIHQTIFLIRGQKVILDAHLAELYAVETRTLIQAVTRNIKRFPRDFMFQLTKREFANLRSQIVISSLWGGRRSLPYAFTEQGVAMLSSVLRSTRAIEVNIAIMRTFVQLRRLMDANRDLARKIEALEKKYDEQYGVRGRRWIDCIGRMVMWPSDREVASQFAVVFEAIKQLITQPEPRRRRIGFHQS